MFLDKKYIYYVLAFLSSNVCFKLLSLLAPTVNFQVGNIGDLPIIINDKYLEEINELAKENINICKEVWDNRETSWDFTVNPLLRYNIKELDKCYINYNQRINNLYDRLKENEERINEIFIEIYELSNVCTKEVIDRDLTVKKLNKEKEMKKLISYIIGCIFGRFKINDEYAPFDVIKYKDINNEIKKIIGLIFDDKSYDYLNNIIDIDKYINKEFYEEHLKMYQKVPIYMKVTHNKEKYLLYIHKGNEALKELGIKEIKDYDLDDGCIVNISKINKRIKNYIN